jgi:hypothetical protein
MAQNTQRRQSDSKSPRRGPGEGTVDVLPSGKLRVRLPTPEGRRKAAPKKAPAKPAAKKGGRK